MDESFEDDDFGGFEVADADSDPISLSVDDPLPSEADTSASGQDVSSIPWLAARIQASAVPENSSQGGEPASSTAQISSSNASTIEAFADFSGHAEIDWSKTSKPETVNVVTPLSADADSSHSTEAVNELKSQLESALKEKQDYRSEVTDLKLKHEEYTKNVERLQTELANQRKRYEDVQSKHQAELEEMKGANHKALSVIVEEYKESVKLSSVEQQQACAKVFTEIMEKEAARFQKVFDEQAKSYESWKTEFSERMNKKHEETLVKLRSDVEEEKKELKVKFEREVELINERVSLLNTESVTDIRAQLSTKLSELDLKCKELVDKASEELKVNVKSHVREATDNERAASLDHWEKHSLDMMKRLQETLDSSIKSHKDSMDEYITQKAQTDQLSRRKQLSAINVYLEAASKHISDMTDESSTS